MLQSCKFFQLGGETDGVRSSGNFADLQKSRKFYILEHKQQKFPSPSHHPTTAFPWDHIAMPDCAIVSFSDFFDISDIFSVCPPELPLFLTCVHTDLTLNNSQQSLSINMDWSSWRNYISLSLGQRQSYLPVFYIWRLLTLQVAVSIELNVF